MSSLARFQSVNTLRQRGDEFRERANKVRQSDHTRALRLGKAVWGGGGGKYQSSVHVLHGKSQLNRPVNSVSE